MRQKRQQKSFICNWLIIDRTRNLSLHRQISDQLRRVILDGTLEPGDCLPSSRSLAADLNVSRNTTLRAYDQLIAEGFIATRRGSATTVSMGFSKSDAALTKAQALSRKIPAHTDIHVQEIFEGEPTGVVFQPGIPAFDTFPRLQWSRLLKRHALRSDQFILDYAHMGGYFPLRLELAKYLASSRGVVCDPQQVIITTSTRAAIETIARVLWPLGSSVAVEDPGYVVAKRVLSAAGYALQFVPVDGQGICVDAILATPEPPAGVYLTPTHQWPTGSALSAPRRVRLVEWARNNGAWLVEDDYDSEFRFDCAPIATLQSIASDKVIFIGTFSKTFAPSVRTSYFVVPPALAERFEQEVYLHGVEPPLHIQGALSDFISSGHYTRHIRSMSKLYAHRRVRLLEAIQSIFGDCLKVELPRGGLQIIAQVADHVSASEFAQKAAKADLVARPMAAYQVYGDAPNALHLGFAAVPDQDIEPNVRRLYAAVSELFETGS